MYLKEVYIKNFRSIKECKVSLDDFTVFIGENNAKKTTILWLRLCYIVIIKGIELVTEKVITMVSFQLSILIRCELE